MLIIYDGFAVMPIATADNIDYCASQHTKDLPTESTTYACSHTIIYLIG